MLAEQLELKRKQDDLADRERDYATVVEQLRLEGDAPRRNQFERQLEGLLQKIKQLETEIIDLQQVIQQGRIQSASDALHNILQIHKSCFADMLVACQWIFEMRKYVPTSEPTGSQEIIPELLKIQKGRSQQHSALEQFAAHLMSCSQNSALLIALQTWGEQHSNSWTGVRKAIEDQQKQQIQNAQPVVMAKISLGEIESAKSQVENYYRFDAWLIHDKEQYKTQQQKFDSFSELISHYFAKYFTKSMETEIRLTGEEAYPIADLISHLPQLLTRILEEVSSRFTNDPEIHIFLPLELMNLNVDCWLLDDEDEFPVLLGHDYKVVLRCNERVQRNYRQRPRWVRKWQQQQSLLQNKSFEVFKAADDSDLDALSAALHEVEDEDTTIGLKVTQAPSQAQPDKLFRLLFKSGLPLAIWGRCDLLEPTNEAELDRVLQACCLESLPSVVKKERYQSRTKNQDCHIGHHLSLLWDDPDLLPPKSA